MEKQTARAPCSRFIEMVLDGMMLDEKASNLDGLSKTELQDYMEELRAQNKSTPKCVFFR